MRRTHRFVIVSIIAALGASLATPAALAGDKGKSGDGCADSYNLGYWDASTGQLYYANGTVETRTQDGLTQGFLTKDALDALLSSIDHNGNGSLCFKLPNGWTSGNTDNRTYFVNLVDDKIVS